MNTRKLPIAFVLGMLLLATSFSSILAYTMHSPVEVKTSDTPSAISCAELSDPDQKIGLIVELARTETQDAKDVRACYDTLTDGQKTQVFERAAREMGLGEELDDERDGYLAGAMQPLLYGTILTPWMALGTGEQRTPYVYWTDNGSRCPTDRGTETNFAYSFSTNVTNPSTLRANSPWNVLVDSAILYYTVQFGGLKTWYDTNSSIITTCVGNTALSTVGGANVWKANAAVYKP